MFMQETETADAVEAEAQKAFTAVRDWMTTASVDDVRPATAIEGVRLAADLLNFLSNMGDFNEFAEDLSLTAGAMGQALLKNLPHVMDGQRMTAAQKVYWLEVAEELGPDWIEMLRMTAAFVKRVESF